MAVSPVAELESQGSPGCGWVLSGLVVLVRVLAWSPRPLGPECRAVASAAWAWAWACAALSPRMSSAA